jgi:HTH-type transcriptional regulator/antitoxin HipB
MRVRTSIELGLVIRNYRQQLGLSQSELARRADVGRQWLVAVEQGKPGAEIGLVLRTLSALGATLSVTTIQAAANVPTAGPPDIDLNAVVAAARTTRS